MEDKRVVCHFCKGRCRIVMHTEGGRLVGFDEDPTFPRKTWFKSCPRIGFAKEFMYHPERLGYPLKRAGERGEGKWQTIPWEQAFDEIAGKLQKLKARYGAETLALLRGTARMNEFEGERFANLFGTPNHTCQIVICFGPFNTISTAMFGWSIVAHSGPVTSLNTRCFMVVGVGQTQAFLGTWQYIREQKKLGAKLIVIDPREIPEAKVADLWLQPRPATDTALLMGMINVIIEEDLYDHEFVEKWCYGFDKLRERAKDYPLDRVAEITWVPAEKIREAARMYAMNRPASVDHGMGLEQQPNSVIAALQALNILVAITGNVDIPGGNCYVGPSQDFIPHEVVESDAQLSLEQKMKQIGGSQFKVMSWIGDELIQEPVRKLWGKRCASTLQGSNAHPPSVFRAMITGKPYPVRAAIECGSNAMVAFANTKLVYKALKSLDLYVINDYWLTPSADLADYVLPVASWMERPWLWDWMGNNSTIYAGEQGLPNSVPGEYDHKTDWEIFRGIGIRLGQDWPWENLEQLFDYRLSPRGITLKEFMTQGGFSAPAPEFRKYEKMGGFATRTGKCELYLTVLEQLGLDPLPSYEEGFETPISTPEVADEFPLMLITGGKFMPMFHSEFRQIDTARRRRPNPLVQVNPDTAARLGIGDGDWIWIETRRGRIRMRCQLFAGIDPGVVHCEHGWWFPELPGEEPWLHGVWESNANVLTEDNPKYCNKGNGGWPLKTALCRIYKCKVYGKK